MKQKGGHFVISLDFELMWGMFDKVTEESYGAHLSGVHTVIPRILELFEARNIHATWATVGMLMASDERTLRTHLPHTTPNYMKSELSSYSYIHAAAKLPREHHFAPKLVMQINNTHHQEVASHTFSHYYTKESQENFEAAFASDCKAMGDIATSIGVVLSSIVFPRNQWTEKALDILKKYDITTYRGTEDHFLYRARTEDKQTNLFIRALRLLDHYINISGHHTYNITAINRSNKNDSAGKGDEIGSIYRTNSELTNVPASRFLRPYSKRLSFLEPMRLLRIKRAMTHAAKNGEVFHLWWHPHNFGVNQEENFKNLTEILDHYANLQNEYGMQSQTMREISTLVSG